MSSRYGSFKVDPSIRFDDFYTQPSCEVQPITRANFSRPIFIQTSGLQSSSSLPLSPPPLTRSESSDSLRGQSSPNTPITPAQNTISQPFRFGPALQKDKIESSHKETLCSSSLMPDARDPDLRFSFEARVSKEYEAPAPSLATPPSTPPQLLKRFSERDRHARPHTAHQSPVETSNHRMNAQEPMGTPPTVTSFAEFRQALAERQEARRQEAAKNGGVPALSFLSQDPFQCPLTKRRPKSASREELVSEDEGSSRPVSRKSVAPSIASSRSTRSIRRGLSRVVKKLLPGSTKGV